ncbi:hypothetical protein LUZ61_009680 [Rhynchospora tenuis]|uniref:F-box domain-containing protein n=1 Tax=Rhynchospora tenuis TaxID=198213 RepID=A0AAD5ZXR3_9POAL|nr:hypothetical protein LUZ61_009680 [Rhynchospora tenuis]
MAPSDSHQIDRLSSLPDELLVRILSFLPIRMAARTSVLSRRFRHLCEAVWETSPSLELISNEFPHRKTSTARFVTMAERTLLRRSPSHTHPLLILRLELSRYFRFSSHDNESLSFFDSLFVKARSLEVRHLTIEGCQFSPSCDSLSLIFSINTLESLSLPMVGTCQLEDSVFPSAVALTNLKSLSFEGYIGDPDKLNLLLSHLPSLEYFCFTHGTVHAFSLSSLTVRKLRLIIYPGSPEHETVDLSFPSLELLHVHNGEILGLPHICGNIPSLRKAVLQLNCLRKEDCSAVAGLLNSISHSEELILHIKENDREMYPFPILLEPGKDLPRFPNLKHLDATMCFHKYNFEAIVALLHHSPALESLKLFHKVSLSNSQTCERNKNDWRSILPRNARKAHYMNLHLGQHSKEFMKLVGKQCTPKVVERHY